MAGVGKKKNADTKPVCKYGSKCYRKNPQHIQNYKHPGRSDDDDNVVDDATLRAVETKPEKRKKEKTISDYFGKPSQTQCASGSDSEESGAGQPLKKKKTENDESLLQEKKVPVDDEAKAMSQETTDNEENDDDVDESLSVSPDDVKENIKKKFLMDMPDDFYKFWEFCQSLSPDNPRCALEDTLNLVLVGPFDILSGRHKSVEKNKYGRRPNFLLHYRYFYDPPEFQTVVASSEKSKFHLGYYRDDPKEEPVFVASNSPGESSAEKIYLCGENLFAAVHIYASKLLKLCSEKKKSIEQLIQSIKQEAKKHNLPLNEVTEGMKKRKKKVVCPTFHGAGIVVPVVNDVGYRPVPETPGNLRALLKKITEATTEEEKEKKYEDLQELMTLVQFANDECDYGEGLELGLDLFSFGAEIFHPQIASLLPLAYQLLNRHEFSKIIEIHLKRRRRVIESVDELAV